MKKGAFFSAALLSAALFLSSCSVFEGQDGASVSFTITGDMVKAMGGSRSLSPTEAGSLFLEITLEGGHSDVKTVPIVEGQAAVFDGVPIGASVSAIGKAFVEYGGAKVPTYTGKSDAILVKEGDNQLTLYLKKSGFYVSSTGDDTNGDGTQQNPYATLGAAVTKIYALNDPTVDYTIIIDGTVTGDAGGAYAQSKIEDDASIGQAIPAKSITLSGAHSLDAAGNPQDAMDRGLLGAANGNSSGTVLVVNTAVPVTITNLKITGGYNSNDNGGGITVAQGSTVILSDGAWLIGNKSYSNGRGGAVHNEGALFVCGTAVIGNKAAATWATDSSGQRILIDGYAANYATSGGGIFNGRYNTTANAKCYLGFSGYAADGVTPVKREWTGGLYYNGGQGGAIFNSIGCYVRFDSGTMKWNSTADRGGAIHNDGNGTVEMTGGQIIYNRSFEQGNYTSYGGGVCNEKSSSKFIMSGGTINHNEAQNDKGYGGGVWNCGYFYMYGSAVIGDKNANSMPDGSSYGNKAQKGGGFYNSVNDASSQHGRLYLGYKPGSDGTTPVKERLYGGIFYNYSYYTGTDENTGGGAIGSVGTIKMDSGTIAWNYAKKYGGAIFHSHNNTHSFELTGGTIRDNSADGLGGAIFFTGNSNDKFYIGGNPKIPAGADGKHDLYMSGSDTYYSPIVLIQPLDAAFNIRFTPQTYKDTMVVLQADAGATGISIPDERLKFSVTPQTMDDGGSPIDPPQKWIIGTDGKLQKYIASTGTTITMNTGAGDIGVQVLVGGVAQTYDGTPINAGAATQISFVADSGFKTYTWKLDNHVVNPATDPVELLVPNQLDLIDLGDTTKWPTGVYEIELEAVAQDGTPYSFSAQVTVQ